MGARVTWQSPGMTPSSQWPPDAQPRYHSTLIAALAASVGIMIGSVNPWVSAMVVTINGLDAGNWGKMGLILGGLSCAALLAVMFSHRTRFNPRWAVPVVWAAAVAGVACLCFALAFLIRILTLPKANFFGLSVGASAGWGLWLLAVSAAVLLITASIVADQLTTYVDALPGPWGQPQTSWTKGWRFAAITTSAIIALSAIAYFGVKWNDDSGDGPATAGLPSFTTPSFSMPSFTAPEITTSDSPTSTSSTTPYCAPGHNTDIGCLPVVTPTTTTTPAIPEVNDPAPQVLRGQADADRPVVTAWAMNRWVPQLSSKQPGSRDDGVIWTDDSIWDEHTTLRQKYDAKLLWSGDWPKTFKRPDFWVTVAGMSYPDRASAQAWCDAHGRDADHCFPTLIQ